MNSEDRNPKVVSIERAISAGPDNNEEIKMSNRKNTAGASGTFSLLTLAVAAIAICAAAVLLAPNAAPFQASAAATYTGPSGYFPDGFVNQAKEIEPMPDTYSATAYLLDEPVTKAKEIDAMPEMYY